MAIAGHNVVISVATGNAATFAVMDGIKNCSLSDSVDMLEITDFADSNVKRNIAGLRTLSLSMDGDLEVNNTAGTAFANLRYCKDNGLPIHVKFLTDGTSGIQLAMLVSSFERSASVDGTVQVSISMEHEGSVAPAYISSGL